MQWHRRSGFCSRQISSILSISCDFECDDPFFLTISAVLATTRSTNTLTKKYTYCIDKFIPVDEVGCIDGCAKLEEIVGMFKIVYF